VRAGRGRDGRARCRFAVIGGALTLLSGLLRERGEPGSGGNGRVDPGLVLNPGEYFHVGIRSSEATDGWIRDEETWWALDGLGEVRNNGTRQDKFPRPPPGVYEAGEFPVELFAGKDVSRLSTDSKMLATQLQTESPYTDILTGVSRPGTHVARDHDAPARLSERDA
jgi:hypothetical protein